MSSLSCFFSCSRAISSLWRGRVQWPLRRWCHWIMSVLWEERGMCSNHDEDLVDGFATSTINVKCFPKNAISMWRDKSRHWRDANCVSVFCLTPEKNGCDRSTLSLLWYVDSSWLSWSAAAPLRNLRRARKKRRRLRDSVQSETFFRRREFPLSNGSREKRDR